MNLFLKSAITVAFAFNVLACAKSNNNEPPTPGPLNEQSLDGKSFNEVMQLKYDKALLTCTLWSQYGLALDRTQSPNDQFTWDLLASPKSPDADKKFQLKGQALDQSVRLEFAVQDLKILSTEVRALDGSQYKMTSAPMIEVKFIKEELIVQGNLQTYSSKYNGESSIFERVPDKTLDARHEIVGANEKYFTLVECFLDTQSKPAYQNQFSKTK